MSRHCPRCKCIISYLDDTCPFCGCDVKKEDALQLEVVICIIVPLLIAAPFENILENGYFVFGIWLIAQIVWLKIYFSLKQRKKSAQISDNRDTENQNSTDNTNLENQVLQDTHNVSSESNQSISKSQNTTEKQRGRRIEI